MIIYSKGHRREPRLKMHTSALNSEENWTPLCLSHTTVHSTEVCVNTEPGVPSCASKTT